MIKRFLLLLIASVLIVPTSFADTAPSSSDKKDIPVIIHKAKENDVPNKHMPSASISAIISIEGERMSFLFPFDQYPLQVDIEMETEPYGCWSVTLLDEQSALDGFGALPGDYKLTVITTEVSTYIGYFSLE